MDNKYIAHYGVMGMKWGVRKDGKPQGYQYKRSSTSRARRALGAVGRGTVRATKAVGRGAVTVGRGVATGVSSAREAYKYHKMTPKQKQDYQLSRMSDEELSKFTERLRKENSAKEQIAISRELSRRGQEATRKAVTSNKRTFRDAARSGALDASAQVAKAALISIAGSVLLSTTGININPQKGGNKKDKKPDKDDIKGAVKDAVSDAFKDAAKEAVNNVTDMGSSKSNDKSDKSDNPWARAEKVANMGSQRAAKSQSKSSDNPWARAEKVANAGGNTSDSTELAEYVWDWDWDNPNKKK